MYLDATKRGNDGEGREKGVVQNLLNTITKTAEEKQAVIRKINDFYGFFASSRRVL